MTPSQVEALETKLAAVLEERNALAFEGVQLDNRLLAVIAAGEVYIKASEAFRDMIQRGDFDAPLYIVRLQAIQRALTRWNELTK